MSEKYPYKKYEHIATIYADYYLKTNPDMSPAEFAKKYLEIEKEVKNAISKPISKPFKQLRED
ncbi:hypothetical protein HV819_07605 [Anaerococcus sp. AGMB00486]|uniref:Uncharacterized protein n=1 Tax=Anaerococcus faecalis TaxID=2742993 RepID=A0ABX2NAU9_9FIRM|nr:hypothetical protein [Anaerococcus faecalis]NVF11842.1 hypothetical protein [Anaerococcus faecalis]